mmetsp:Transcript_4848/g.14809  ORF Transcript_4848/g.14809 Transcript_4848/m.14809 type:complete len:353 (+) Transcript_4848:1-1059(+)
MRVPTPSLEEDFYVPPATDATEQTEQLPSERGWFLRSLYERLLDFVQLELLMSLEDQWQERLGQHPQRQRLLARSLATMAHALVLMPPLIARWQSYGPRSAAQHPLNALFPPLLLLFLCLFAAYRALTRVRVYHLVHFRPQVYPVLQDAELIQVESHVPDPNNMDRLLPRRTTVAILSMWDPTIFLLEFVTLCSPPALALLIFGVRCTHLTDTLVCVALSLCTTLTIRLLSSAFEQRQQCATILSREAYSQNDRSWIEQSRRSTTATATTVRSRSRSDQSHRFLDEDQHHQYEEQHDQPHHLDEDQHDYASHSRARVHSAAARQEGRPDRRKRRPRAPSTPAANNPFQSQPA